MAAPSNDHRIDDIIVALDVIKKKLPNGELERIGHAIDSLNSDQKLIKADLEYFKKRLFDPDDGVIVKINKNTENIIRIESDFGNSDTMIPDMRYDIQNIKKWKSGVDKALWIVFSTVAGIIIAFIFGRK